MAHYRHQERGLGGYDPRQVILPSRPDLDQWDFVVMDHPTHVAVIVASSQARSLQLIQLSTEQIADLVAFLEALTDPRARDLRDVIPASVPSGHMTRQTVDVSQGRDGRR